MNCLINLLATVLGSEEVMGPKVIGWLGGKTVLLPEREWRRDQSLLGSVRWLVDSTLFRQACLDDSEMVFDILWFSSSITGFCGFILLSASLCLIRVAALQGIFGMKSRRYPTGMACLEAARRILQKIFSPLAHEVGGSRLENCASDSRKKLAKSVILKFV